MIIYISSAAVWFDLLTGPRGEEGTRFVAIFQLAIIYHQSQVFVVFVVEWVHWVGVVVWRFMRGGKEQYLVQRAQWDASYRHAALKPSAEYDEISSVPTVPFYEIPAVFFFFLRQVTHTRCISCQRKDKMLPLDTLAAFLLNSWDTRGSKCFWFIENAAIARLLIPHEGTIRYSLIQGASPTSMGWAPLFFFFLYTSSFYFTQCALKISNNIAFSIQSCVNVQEYQGEAVIVDELWGPIRQHSKDARKTH